MKFPGASRAHAYAIDFITDHRGWFVVLFVLPLSLAFDVFFAARAWCIRIFFSAPELHDKRVEKICEDIHRWRERGDGTKLCTARGGWQSISPGSRSYKKHSTQIACNLYDILSWSEKEMIVRVEPLVNMGQLSHFLIPKGYTLPVLPEMDDLTVGGLYMGVGIETNCHKYGLFNDNIISAEVILASGKVITCDAKGPHKDLFRALPWSYGTLGFLASVTIKIIPCKKYVCIKYIPCSTQKEGVKQFSQFSEDSESADSADFVEALSYSKEEMVVMPAWFCDDADVAKRFPNATRNTLSWWFKPWFYKHAGGMLHDGRGARMEIVPLRDYYHRHTRSIFWELEQIIPVGNHPLFRLLLGWAVPPKVSFLKLTQTEALKKLYEEQHVIQDMLVPLSEMGKSLDVFEDEYCVYPIWICPYRAYDYSSGDGKEKHRFFLRRPQADRTDEATGKKYEMYVDLGAYGIPKAVLEKKPFDAAARGRAVESYVMSVRGFQMLYADSYLTRDEFYEMFDHTHYTDMKTVYDPKEAFPVVFEKVCKKAQAYWEKKPLTKDLV